ncbi:hypothetical protein [Roseicella aquatilis]|uniref:Uncharacterized protein n=1 Tax=Roseicella aquatilis TaxID=2527868 RepID=A0A4R4D930_9PROT|nr:hypothetical protein [Roseicella aquatilis]TCZ56595.1 hypothetical protein EXY23_19575 [Roseicella aquatilis]
MTLAPAGEVRTLYHWATDRCEDEFIPDAPARAFRRADGRMTLLATHRENWALVGQDFTSLKPSCRSVLRSSEHRREGAGRLWIEATWTHDGRHIAALVSQDLEEPTRREGCEKRGLPGRCWLNNILAARSADMGESFSLLAPSERMVATLGDRYPPGAQARFGAFTTSNIVRQGDAYFMIAYVQGEGVQQAGNCLFRTDDPFQPGRWRGWDGQGFAADLGVPGGRQSCTPLPSRALPGEVRSLTYDTRHATWLAVFRARLALPGDAQPVPGFYVAQSPDLLHWQAPRRIVAAPTRARIDDPDIVANYPSLLDPGSKSRNFDTIDSGRPVLLYTVQHLQAGRGSMNRDLRYLPLRVE